MAENFSYSLWLQILTIAIINDLVDFFGIFPNLIETALDLLTGILIILLIKMKTFEAFQPKVVNKITTILAFMIVIDLLPFIDIAPLWTLSVLALHNDFHKLDLLMKTYSTLNNLSKMLIRNPLPWSYIVHTISKAGNYLREVGRMLSREVREEVLRLANEMKDYAIKHHVVEEEYPSEEEARLLVSLIDSWLSRLVDLFE